MYPLDMVAHRASVRKAANVMFLRILIFMVEPSVISYFQFVINFREIGGMAK
jgi:hypothetical protein